DLIARIRDRWPVGGFWPCLPSSVILHAGRSAFGAGQRQRGPHRLQHYPSTERLVALATRDTLQALDQAAWKDASPPESRSGAIVPEGPCRAKVRAGALTTGRVTHHRRLRERSVAMSLPVDDSIARIARPITVWVSTTQSMPRQPFLSQGRGHARQAVP